MRSVNSMDEKKKKKTTADIRRGQREECPAQKVSGGVLTPKQPPLATPLVRDKVAAKPQKLRTIVHTTSRAQHCGGHTTANSAHTEGA